MQSQSMATKDSCSLDDITTCPSARIIKIFLKILDKWKNTVYLQDAQPADQRQRIKEDESELAQSLSAIANEYGYTITKLIDDLHHLKYEHNMFDNDDRFDAAYDFFKDTMSGNGCDIDNCPFIERHYRDRGRAPIEHKMEEQDHLLMDILSMIHCYFLHSFDTERFTKEERERIMKVTGSKSWKSLQTAIDIAHDDDDEKIAMAEAVLNVTTEIVRSKKRRGRVRFQDEDREEKSVADGFVDFAAMSLAVGVKAQVLEESLSDYQRDLNHLMSDLIDAVYGGNTEKTMIWERLQVDNEEKRRMCRAALYRYCECIHLDSTNLAKMIRLIIER